jgi:hypothetical protein
MPQIENPENPASVTAINRFAGVRATPTASPAGAARSLLFQGIFRRIRPDAAQR